MSADVLQLLPRMIADASQMFSWRWSHRWTQIEHRFGFHSEYKPLYFHSLGAEVDEEAYFDPSGLEVVQELRLMRG